MRTPFLLVFWLMATTLNAQHLPAYTLHAKDGSAVTFGDVLAAAREADLIFFGEHHNNPIHHWLQLELVKALADDPLTRLVVGMEMFEADQQILLDEYAAGHISRNSFESEARIWTNYKTDYRPIVEFAKGAGVPVVATNIPRRYASMVYSKGLASLDGLSDEAKAWIAPLPIEVDLTLPGYAEISKAAGGHGGANLPTSQAVKDATMAHFTLRNLLPGSRFLHLNGAYHSDNGEGIIWYVKRQRGDLRILTITAQEGEAPEFTKADFTIVTPAGFTKTH